jgi:hypothetical protein
VSNFAGSTLVVSHDRWFLDRVATHILAFEGDSQVGGVSVVEGGRKLSLRPLSREFSLCMCYCMSTSALRFGSVCRALGALASGDEGEGGAGWGEGRGERGEGSRARLAPPGVGWGFAALHRLVPAP